MCTIKQSGFAISAFVLLTFITLTGCPKFDVTLPPNDNSDDQSQDQPNENSNTNTNTNTNSNTNTNDNSDNQTDTTYSGQATVFRANIAGNQTVLVDSGILPAAGGVLDTAGLTVEVPGVLFAEVGHASVFGGNGITISEAALANIDLTVGTHKIQADYLMARATAECSALVDGSGSARGELIASNLRIDDQVTTVTAAPNQEISLRDGSGQVVGRVVLNEQVVTTNGVNANIVVNGLKIEVANVATIVLFSATAGVDCGTGKLGDDFVTGGGFFDGSNGHDYFAVAGGTIAGAFHGHLAFKDTGSGMRVIGTGITGYTFIDTATRRIDGNCEVDGVGGFTYSVEATDNGEPGSADKFILRLSNGYEAAGQLLGGNIQLHANGQ